MTTSAQTKATFERLLAQYGKSIARVARVYARGQAESADLMQDIAMAVWLALPGFRGECSERTFVFRIAHNRGISFAERARVRARVNQGNGDESEIAEARPGPEELLDAARRSEALWRALATLSVGARAVISLELEGLPHAEIAEVLGSTPNSVAVRLSRARTELRQRLTAWEDRHGA
jgi:RNA polymerase sigma-70 factor (ECF subfamily)